MSGKLSKNQAKKTGEFLINCVNFFGEEALFVRSVVGEWREAHKEVFLEVPETLKDISYSIDSRAVVVVGLKRMDTIVGKLRRLGLNIKFNEMCDIVGRRVVASDIEAVRQISAAIEKLRACSGSVLSLREGETFRVMFFVLWLLIMRSVDEFLYEGR